MSNKKTVIVIGGGITGLSTAYHLQKQAREKGLQLRILLFEKDKRVGGNIKTDVFDGFVVEKGPDSFLARKAAAFNLCVELGLKNELVGTNPHNKKTYILHKDKLHRIPAGMNIGVPTQFVPFATTGLLSLTGKLRAAVDFVLPRNQQSGDQSLGDFLARRLGDEVVDHMAEPLLAGIYAGNSRNLSLRATFPQFEEMEQKHRSMIVGMLAQSRQAKMRDKPAATATKSETSSAANSTFVSLRGGLIQLVEKLAEILGPEVIHTSSPVKKINQAAVKTKHGGCEFEVILEDGQVFQADSIVVTTPTFIAAGLLPDSFAAAAALEQIPYMSVATVALGFLQSSIQYPLDGTGFVVPKKEGRTITACTWVSSKWEHTAPPDSVLLRCYVGRDGDQQIVNETDRSIVQKVTKDLKDCMGIDKAPYYTSVTRWRKAMPQYTVGHLERMAEFENAANDHYPGLFFAGAGHTGLGIPDCIQQGKDKAAMAMRFMNE